MVLLLITRYFNTKQVMPFLANHLATSNPSLSIDNARKAPPGAITMEVPLAFPSSGLKTVSAVSYTHLDVYKRQII